MTDNVDRSDWTDADLVDEMGALFAGINDLKADADAIKGELIERGLTGEVYGDEFVATVTPVSRRQINWQLIAQKLRPSRQLVTAHTRTLKYTTVRVDELEQED